MTDMIDTHITARLPGDAHAFLINRYGVLFHEMRASDLVKIDHRGHVVDERAAEEPARFRVNAAGFTIHSAIHMAREDLGFVIHTHTAAGTAVSAQEHGLLPISQHALKFYGKLGYHDYEGIALNEAEKPRLVRDLGSNTYLMLRNHGLLTVGASPADAFVAMYFFEASCMIQVRAQSGGAKLTPIPQPILDGIKEQIRAVTSGTPGALAWPGLLRRLDRRSPGYAD